MRWCASNHPVSYRKGLGNCDALLCMFHTLQNAMEIGQESGIMLIDFSAAFDMINNHGFLYKLYISPRAGDELLQV